MLQRSSPVSLVNYNFAVFVNVQQKAPYFCLSISGHNKLQKILTAKLCNLAEDDTGGIAVERAGAAQTLYGGKS